MLTHLLETDTIPADQLNDKGMILLGYAGDGDSEHLDVSSYLSSV
jgi:hypothetical protein